MCTVGWSRDGEVIELGLDDALGIWVWSREDVRDRVLMSTCRVLA